MVLDESVDDYVARLKNAIRSSGLSEPLKGAVLASMAYVDYFGLGVVIIRVPEQNNVSFLDGKVYVRQMDDSVEVAGASAIVEVSQRFR